MSFNQSSMLEGMYTVVCCVQGAVRQRGHKRDMLRYALAHLSQRRLLADLMAWHHRAAVQISKYVVATGLACVMVHVIKSLRRVPPQHIAPHLPDSVAQQARVGALDTLVLPHRRAGAAQLQIAVGAWTHTMLVSAWRAWTSARERGRLGREAVDSAARLWQSQGLARAWRAWRAEVESSAELAEAVSPVIGAYELEDRLGSMGGARVCWSVPLPDLVPVVPTPMLAICLQTRKRVSS